MTADIGPESTWDDVLQISRTLGFEPIGERVVVDELDKRSSRIVIAAHPELKLIFYATSTPFNEDSAPLIWEAWLCGVHERPSGRASIFLEFFKGISSMGPTNKRNCIWFHTDASGGLLTPIHRLQFHGRLVNWGNPTGLLEMLEELQEEPPRRWYQRRKKYFLQSTPPWVQNFILGD